MAGVAGTAPQVGDQVILPGTRIIGDVMRIDSDGGDWVTLRVTAIVGKSPTSKASRAWRGAWITCTPETVARPAMP